MSLEDSYIQMQLGFLGITLALAGEIPKRSGDFETTYKTENGKEIVVKRSPDGKFASKSGGSTASVATKPDETTQLDPQVARENGKVVREILTGKTGDDLKKDLAAEFNHRPIIKEAIEKVDFVEVAKGDADALTNINNFMQRKFKEAVDAASMLGRELAAAAVAVAGYTARWLAFGLALRGTLLVPASVGLIKQGETPKEVLKRVAELSPEFIKEVFSLKNIGRLARRGAIIEGVFRAIDLAAHLLKKPTPPLVEPEADKALQQALVGIGNNTLHNSLIAGAVQSLGVAEGIKSTNIENVIEGSQDAFSNAVAFMRDKVEEAATVVSENKKEIAIGAAVVALAVASAGATAIFNTVAIRAGLTTVLGLLKGSSFSDALILGLKSAAPEKIKALVSQKIYALAISYRLGITAHQAIKEQVESVKLARSGGIGAKSFGQKEEAVKKLVAEEGLDYEAVLRAIVRRKEELPDPRKSAKVQKQILELENEIQEGVVKVGKIVKGKLSLGASELNQIAKVARRETAIRNEIIEQRGLLDQVEGRGFSVSRRLTELIDVAEKKGKDAPSYKWRTNVIKAEIQYGEQLDKLNELGGYSKLLSKMEKSKPAPGKYTAASNSDNNKITALFTEGLSPSSTQTNLRPEIVNEANAVGTKLQKYLTTPINAQVVLAGRITCALPGSNNKYAEITKNLAETEPALQTFMQTEIFKSNTLDGAINIGDVGLEFGGQKFQGYNPLSSIKDHIKEMMWHESGHLLEVKLGKVEESAAFREERALEVPGDRKVLPPLGLSVGSQDYALGAFYSPYVGLRMKGRGKYANTDRATEVLSSGMELLSSPSMVKRAAKADRETILYALAAMSEKVKD